MEIRERSRLCGECFDCLVVKGFIFVSKPFSVTVSNENEERCKEDDAEDSRENHK